MRWAVLFCAGLTIGIVWSAVLAAPGQAPALAAQPAQSEQPIVTSVAGADPLPLDRCVPAPLPQRAGQLLLVGIPDVTSADDPLAQEVVDVGVAGVFLNDSNAYYDEQVRDLTFDLRAASRHELLIATDEESGRVSTFRPLIGTTSSPRTLASTMTPDQVREYATDLGSDLSALGVNLDLAPVADLDDGPSGGLIGDRSFSAEASTAGEYATAFAQGLQDAGVTPVVKHFPGHGRADGDVHRGADVVDATVGELMRSDVGPFVTAIDAGLPVMMVSHVEYTALDEGLPASLSPMTYQLLRSLGFDGVAMTDSLGMGAINRRWDFPEAAVRAVAAGADLVLATDGRRARDMRDAIVAAVRAGRLGEARLNDGVSRVLTLKGIDPEPVTCTAVEGPVAEEQELPAPAG